MRLTPAILFLPPLLAATISEAQSPAPGTGPDSARAAQAAVCTELIRRQLMLRGTADTTRAAYDSTLAQTPSNAGDSNCLSGNPAVGLSGAGAPLPGMNPQMMAAMATMAGRLDPAQMAQIRAMMSQMQAGMADMGSQMSPVTPSQSDEGGSPGMPPGMAMPSMSGFGGMGAEKPIELSSHLVQDLKKGKTAVRNISWEPGAGTVASSGSAAFERAMNQVAAAIRQAGGSYRLDLYMDQQSAKAVVRTLGPLRLGTAQSALARRGVRPELGGIRQDGDPRLEIIRLK